MRLDLINQIIGDPFMRQQDYTNHFVAAIRNALHKNPVKAEEAVGAFYGWIFKKREAAYDKNGGRK
jgi:hypothetical protein